MILSSEVSVIIPVFNGEAFIAQAVASVLAQTAPPGEIIVVDDGSDDATPAILRRWEPRITVRRIPHQGVSQARNVGLSLARGRAIAFLDHDDIWFNGKLEKQLRALERFPDAGLVACNYWVRYERFKNHLVRHYSTLRNYPQLNYNAPLREPAFRLLLEENFIGTPSMILARRSVIERVGYFNPRYQMGEDLDYFLRAALVTRFVLLSDPLSYKRTHRDNVTRDPILFYVGQKEVLRRAMRDHQATIRAAEMEGLCGLVLARTNYSLGNVYYEQGRRWAAFLHYFQGLAYSCTWMNARLFLATFIKKFVRLLTCDRLTERLRVRLQQT